MFKKFIIAFLLFLFLCVNYSFAQCSGNSCPVNKQGGRRAFKTPVRTYFAKVKPIRHALMLDRK